MAADPSVLQALRGTAWRFEVADRAAMAMMRERIETAARERRLVNYSDLVKGIRFQVASVNGGRPFGIDDWSDLDRAVVGDLLGRLNLESYERDGLFLSSLVVLKDAGEPGPGYTNFMLQIGVIRSRSEALIHWVEEVRRVHDFFAGTR